MTRSRPTPLAGNPSGIVLLLIGLTIATFFGFFVVEAILWSVPLVSKFLVPQLNPDVSMPAEVQSSVLRRLFQNQGVYNLLLALGGVRGLLQLRGPNAAQGEALLTFLLVFAVGAALTLLATTQAYVLGLAQLVPPAAALLMLLRPRTRPLDPG